MKFARFLYLLCSSLMLAMAVIAILPWLKLARPDAQTNWTAGLYVAKIRAADAVKGPRIFAVSGSDLLFSLDTSVLSKHLDHPVINFGSHAGLGLTYILDRITREMRPGDVVVLGLEYELLQGEPQPSELTVQVATFFDHDFARRQPLAERLRYIFGYSVLPSLVEGAKWLYRGPPEGRPGETLDALGNERGNTVAASKRQLFGIDPPGEATASIAPGVKASILAFAGEAARRHVTLYAIPSAVADTPAYRTAGYQDFLKTVPPMFAGLGIPFLGEPALSFLPQQDMYDTIYHANDRGRAIYTARILAALCTRMTCHG
jgi:hypothetical protein